MGAFILGFVTCLICYAVLVAILTVLKYRKVKKARKEMLKGVSPTDVDKLQELLNGLKKENNVVIEDEKESEDVNND